MFIYIRKLAHLFSVLNAGAIYSEYRECNSIEFVTLRLIVYPDLIFLVSSLIPNCAISLARKYFPQYPEHLHYVFQPPTHHCNMYLGYHIACPCIPPDRDVHIAAYA